MHYVEPAFGFRVEHGTAVLAYSGDTGPTPALVELARDADLFLCEATLLEPEGDPHGHLTPDEARSSRPQGQRAAAAAHPPLRRAPARRRCVYDGFELEL